MRLRDAERFSLTAGKLAIVDSKRFWIAPKVLRRLLTDVSAASTRVIVVLAFATVVTDALLERRGADRERRGGVADARPPCR